MKTNPRFAIQSTTSLVTKLATAAGVPQKEAGVFAEALVDADRHGATTHGVTRLQIYLHRIERELIDPKAELLVRQVRPTVLSVDAQNGLGQVQAAATLERLMPIAREFGMGAATVRQSQHCGALSFYANRAAKQDMILLAMTNAEPAMSPTGGREPFFGTNPLAASFPTGKGYPVKIDLSTSIIARGNIIAAQKAGRPIPDHWALAPDGTPTTDADAALAGTVLTMAGHKGYALAMMVEMFSSVLSGAAIGDEVGSMYKNLDRPQNVGHFFLLMDIAAWMDITTFKQRIDDAIDRLKSLHLRPGVDEILVPGERSHRTAIENERLGIPIDETTLAEIRQLCTRFQVPFDLKPIVDDQDGVV